MNLEHQIKRIMPLNYDYDEPRRLITQSRLSSYSTSIATENDAQLFGAYSWNLAVVGAFYPLLQIIEVSLRNAINNAAKLKSEQAGFNGFWFDNLPDWKDRNEQGQELTAEQVRKFKNKIRAAKKAAKKALKDKGEVDPIPNLDQIIAQTDFSTWEYIFDKHYYNGSDNNYIWPTGLTKVFKKLPRTTGSNAMFHQRDIIRRRIEEVRSFRNRVSHNEPTWRLADAERKEDIITLLTDKLNNMMELLFWISPKFQRYVTDIGIQARIKQVLNLTELDRYMHTYEPLEISNIEALLALTKQVNKTNLRSHFMIRPD